MAGERMQHIQRPQDAELVIGLVSPVGTDLDQVNHILERRLKLFGYEAVTLKLSEYILDPIDQEIMDWEKDDDWANHSREYKRLRRKMIGGDKMRQTFIAQSVRNNDDPARYDAVAHCAVCAIKAHREQMENGNQEKQNYDHCTSCPVWHGKPQINREPSPTTGEYSVQRTAYIIRSLKRPEEVELLRFIYDRGFYLFGIYSAEVNRKQNLIDKRNLTEDEADRLIEIDNEDPGQFGQKTSKTYQLADFFVDFDDPDLAQRSIERAIDLMFGSPYITPTFGEFAMFHAYTASLRTADLSRQIGAVICRDNEILAYGANECPKFGGGQYWGQVQHSDPEDHRDYTLGYDPNKKEYFEIIADMMDHLLRDEDIPVLLDDTKWCEFLSGCKDQWENLEGEEEQRQQKVMLTWKKIADKVKKGRVGQISEYGRVTHAEMEALSMCARNQISCRDSKMYVTTFPCHMCTKLIIPSGIREVVYIEPYAKSKSFAMYKDEITKEPKEKDNKVLFTPFFGVGPNRFIELFAMQYWGARYRKRKQGDSAVKWKPSETLPLRNPLDTQSYLEREKRVLYDQPLVQSKKSQRKCYD